MARFDMGGVNMSVSEIIDEVKDDVCEKLCKYQAEWDEEKEGVDLTDSEFCRNCPLDRL